MVSGSVKALIDQPQQILKDVLLPIFASLWHYEVINGQSVTKTPLTLILKFRVDDVELVQVICSLLHNLVKILSVDMQTHFKSLA